MLQNLIGSRTVVFPAPFCPSSPKHVCFSKPSETIRTAIFSGASPTDGYVLLIPSSRASRALLSVCSSISTSSLENTRLCSSSTSGGSALAASSGCVQSATNSFALAKSATFAVDVSGVLLSFSSQKRRLQQKSGSRLTPELALPPMTCSRYQSRKIETNHSTIRIMKQCGITPFPKLPQFCKR
jgi:hypothetical protein